MNKEELLEQLNTVEEDLVKVLQIASKAVSQVGTTSSDSFNAQSTEFLEQVKKIHTTLIGYTDVVANHRVYARSDYAAAQKTSFQQRQMSMIAKKVDEAVHDTTSIE